MREVTIIGGGLAGLIASILLKRSGFDVLLIERKRYPFHRVCGEYISQEVLPFLEREKLLPDIDFPLISQFTLSSTSGVASTTRLDLGGFGISRYTLDHHLFQVAMTEGVELETAKVMNCTFRDNQFEIGTDKRNFISQTVIGAFGKRSNLDQVMNRPFFKKRSPYIGVKYHASTLHPQDNIALHNFPGGYCGVSQVESNTTNICYLARSSDVRRFGNIPDLEQRILHQNPLIKELWNNAAFHWKKPEVINEISFENKLPVEHHLLMCGDAAGMITPLCGNGMAMAIHSAKMVSDILIIGRTEHWKRSLIEKTYASQWNTEFNYRLWYGRQVQRLFGSPFASNVAVGLVNRIKPLSKAIIEGTHGKVIE